MTLDLPHKNIDATAAARVYLGELQRTQLIFANTRVTRSIAKIEPDDNHSAKTLTERSQCKSKQ
ncbi:predicted protein [Coccidioides posadasii str. Silveira]|uniref:Predicted protein n=1 Tax=Coccidioides posadasii (strain RMSCC 757 / Silveira) TaxID=443226 RepID=E9CWR5_COCPS|nr:predicted protein [Coccidioides posadasii str. Silveira]